MKLCFDGSSTRSFLFVSPPAQGAAVICAIYSPLPAIRLQENLPGDLITQFYFHK